MCMKYYLNSNYFNALYYWKMQLIINVSRHFQLMRDNGSGSVLKISIT